jgi:uncharacterized protein (TIGR00730 family)
MKESTGKMPRLSPKEMCLVASERVTEIAKEFTDGFNFLEKVPKSVTFFGASQFKENNSYYADARALASLLVKELNYSVISGGGPGIMEAANRGAYEAEGDSIGLLIELPDGQATNQYITRAVSFNHFFVRKVCLAFSAEAFIFYPGGFGTLDEFFELLTLIQTKKVKGVPLICVGSEYWNKIRGLMDKEMASRGTVTAEDTDLFHIVDDHRKIVEIIKKRC